MIGLVDYDLLSSPSSTFIIPNLEIMKLATYYKIEKNKFCHLLSLNETDLSGFEKIYFFSEKHYTPNIPEIYLRQSNVIYGGTAFTNGIYKPFENSLIDFTIPKISIYKEYLKSRYDDGVRAKVISNALDNTYYRMYANEHLPIPPIMSNKKIILYDKNFFYPDWREIIEEISARKPSSIIRIHPIICKKLSEFFEIRHLTKIKRTIDVILDLDIPLNEVYYMLNKYKNQFKADITVTSNVYLQLGGNYATNFQYFKDIIYKLNLLYCFWSFDIPIKIKYEPCFVGFKNPLTNISRQIEIWTGTKHRYNLERTINQKIANKKKINICEEEKKLLLKFYPSAKDLFDQTYTSILKGGRWRV